jgi:hypothetical protein
MFQIKASSVLHKAVNWKAGIEYLWWSGPSDGWAHRFDSAISRAARLSTLIYLYTTHHRNILSLFTFFLKKIFFSWFIPITVCQQIVSQGALPLFEPVT